MWLAQTGRHAAYAASRTTCNYMGACVHRPLHDESLSESIDMQELCHVRLLVLCSDRLEISKKAPKSWACRRVCSVNVLMFAACFPIFVAGDRVSSHNLKWSYQSLGVETSQSVGL